MADQVRLPEAYRALEAFADTWALPSSDARLHKRMTSSMDEIQAFYDAMLPITERASRSPTYIWPARDGR